MDPWCSVAYLCVPPLDSDPWSSVADFGVPPLTRLRSCQVNSNPPQIWWFPPCPSPLYVDLLMYFMPPCAYFICSWFYVRVWYWWQCYCVDPTSPWLASCDLGFPVTLVSSDFAVKNVLPSPCFWPMMFMILWFEAHVLSGWCLFIYCHLYSESEHKFLAYDGTL